MAPATPQWVSQGAASPQVGHGQSAGRAACICPWGRAKASSRPRKTHLCPGRVVRLWELPLSQCHGREPGYIKWQEGVGREFPGGPAVRGLCAFTAGGRGLIPGCGTKMSQSQKKGVGWGRVTIHRRVAEPEPSPTVLFPTWRMQTSRNMALCTPVCTCCCCSVVSHV